MSIYHIINSSTNIVENTIEWDGDTSVWSPPSGSYAVKAGICTEYGIQGIIGDKYNSSGVGIGSTSTDTSCMWIPQS
jgi:hypothetical protein|tara:strand:+ start:560 stop:790 length:231 start_codon:yes stop_codon:yes gene_type:complete